MFRFLVMAATGVCAIESATAQTPQHRVTAQVASDVHLGGIRATPIQLVGDRFFRRFQSTRRSRSPSLFGFSIGIGNYYSDRRSGYYEFDPNAFSGYAYDPYTYGHFEAPDLLNDPYFRERNRYDSHFKSPLFQRKSATHWAPSPTRRSYGHRGAPFQFKSAPVTQGDRSSAAAQLRSACEQLSRSLAARADGEMWLEFLAPERIQSWIDEGDTEALAELLTHYDGVVGNPEYRSISSAKGFATTRSLLRQYVH
jgi:hypothetical protein